MRLAKILKGARLLRTPAFTKAALRHRVGAAVEHLAALRLVSPATLLDVGANKGQFTLACRSIVPEARVIAFEPLPEAADTFATLFAGDDRVELHRVALSESARAVTFHVADRGDSSSLLELGTGQAEAFAVAEERQINVETVRLDEVVDLASLTGPILLKIDVQGAELMVVKGCADLGLIDFVYAELSYVELYRGQPLFHDFADYLRSRGFELCGVFNQVSTAAFGPTQADFLFRRCK